MNKDFILLDNLITNICDVLEDTIGQIVEDGKRTSHQAQRSMNDHAAAGKPQSAKAGIVKRTRTGKIGPLSHRPKFKPAAKAVNDMMHYDEKDERMLKRIMCEVYDMVCAEYADEKENNCAHEYGSDNYSKIDSEVVHSISPRSQRSNPDTEEQYGDDGWRDEEYVCDDNGYIALDEKVMTRLCKMVKKHYNLTSDKFYDIVATMDIAMDIVEATSMDLDAVLPVVDELNHQSGVYDKDFNVMDYRGGFLPIVHWYRIGGEFIDVDKDEPCEEGGQCEEDQNDYDDNYDKEGNDYE